MHKPKMRRVELTRQQIRTIRLALEKRCEGTSHDEATESVRYLRNLFSQALDVIITFEDDI